MYQTCADDVQGWVDPELNETMEGDEMGMRKIENALVDPEANTLAPEDGEDAEGDDKMQEDVEEQRGSKRKHEQTEQHTGSGNGPGQRPKQRRITDPDAGDQDDAQDEKYCFCGGSDSGRMIACDNGACEKKWYHFLCLGIEEAPVAKQWYCDPCRDRLWDEFDHGKGAIR